MRFLLGIALVVPAFTQQSESSPKPPDTANQVNVVQTENLAPTSLAAIQTAAAITPAADSSSAQWLNGGIDLGYRWVGGVGGSEAEYRSVVNLGAGPRLFGMDFSIADPKRRLFDRIDARAYNWGGDPYNTAHVNATKRAIYNLSFDYQNIAYFNAVPSFANPAAPSGFDQQSFDTHRRNTTINLDLFPGRRFRPYVAFYRNNGHGTGISDFVQGADNNYPVPVSLYDATDNYRGGVHIEMKNYHATLEVGGTTYREDDQTNFTGQNSGNRTTPILGTKTELSSLQQAYGIRGDSVYTRGLLTANVNSRITVYGQFLYSQPTTSVHYTELAGGNFATVTTLLMFGGSFAVAAGSAIQPHVSGNAGVEVHATDRLRITQSISTDRQHDSGISLFNQLLLQSLSNPVLVLANSVVQNRFQTVNYTTVETNFFYDLSSRLTLHAGYRFVTGDAELPAGTLSQIGAFETGNLRRNIALAGATYRPLKNLSINAEYEGGFSDRIYFRNSLNDYSRGRVRARYQESTSLAFQCSFQLLDNRNPANDIRFDFLSVHTTAGAYWIPNNAKQLSVSAEYDRAWVNSEVLFRDLPFLTPLVSSYTENAHTGTVALNVALPKWRGGKLTAGGSFVVLTGSRPTSYYQPLATVSIPLHKNLTWNAEWRYYGFSEAFYVYEGFRTNTVTIGLRVAR